MAAPWAFKGHFSTEQRCNQENREGEAMSDDTPKWTEAELWATMDQLHTFMVGLDLTNGQFAMLAALLAVDAVDSMVPEPVPAHEWPAFAMLRMAGYAALQELWPYNVADETSPAAIEETPVMFHGRPSRKAH